MKPRSPLSLLKWMLMPLFDTANQICMKYLGLSTGDLPFGFDWLARVLASPFWWGAIAADVGSFLMWMLILKKSNLSFAVPFNSLQYITILLASYWLFHESLTLVHWLGIALIVSGLILVGTEKSKAA